MQNETEKIIEEYVSRAPETIRNFIASGDWKTDVGSIIQRFNLEEIKTNCLKNEIIFVLIGMEPKSDFVENIKKELEIDSNMAEQIAEDVNKNIFSQVENEIDQMWANRSADGEEEVEQSEEKSTNNIGQSFEDIILNQARAMQPARPADEAGRVTSHEVRDTKTENRDESYEIKDINKVPENLPIKQDEPRAIHNYIGSDPYREPTE